MGQTYGSLKTAISGASESSRRPVNSDIATVYGQGKLVSEPALLESDMSSFQSDSSLCIEVDRDLNIETDSCASHSSLSAGSISGTSSSGSLGLSSVERVNSFSSDVSSFIDSPTAASRNISSSSVNSSKTVNLNDFEILKLLGNGSHGKVYLVRHKSCPSGQLYAMKEFKKKIIVSKGQSRQTKTELEIHMSLAQDEESTCPYIAKLYWAFNTRKRLYMVFEFCSGGELYHHIGQRGRIPIDLARLYAAQIAYTLSFLHRRGIVYRDLKPENLVLCADGNLNLVDFGLCKVYESSNGYEKEKDGFICGTTEYLSPEILGSGQNSLSVDWWALGMVLYEMLTGLPPWYSYNQNMVINGILHRELTFPAYLSDDSLEMRNLRSFLQGLLTKNPEQRLGGVSPDGADAVLSHPFFDDIDWDELAGKRIAPPFVPPNDTATCNFDEKFLSMKLDVETSPECCLPEDEFSYFFFNRHECIRGRDLFRKYESQMLEYRQQDLLRTEKKQVSIPSF
uniref:Protein kinase domain-containing protein n=1 Tax=Aplanochytrium stocchinoi TaxID=215587 RepID=A0A7S3V007_9STRA|mmetsp:Transcript_34437/g.42438  ORF Transcript_34437/g.42438 Transcript_34437/m.42438 type:complete len:510 (+) Transcript_34437:248-1777(+)|eukprot:CAMPEP_0204842730 /NCGR_PEP_ID=MMETSP1346-20131115/47561_1 /ASSEMBLY_ACC=CAM_ASM_000771 /TAXON_ID=215587 /ORGANISM="Aplanochytrium stocchinoi, Strain GSBS06" /LENGTH=509 /DNA_ID=CAMNT_0051981747 /DNA_START=185 /DNA_END=1714 /DNA_ORIENTATION=+